MEKESGALFMLKLFKKRLSNRKGFTLVELLVVVAIIGVLAAIAIPRFTDATASANGAKIQADLRTIDSAIMIHYAAKNAYPADIDALVTAGHLASKPVAPTKDAVINGQTITPAAYGLSDNKDRAVHGTKKVEELGVAAPTPK